MTSSVLALIPQSQINPAFPGHPRSPRVIFGFVFGWPLFVFFRLVTTLSVLQPSVGWQLLLDNNYDNMSYVLGFLKFDIERVWWKVFQNKCRVH